MLELARHLRDLLVPTLITASAGIFMALGFIILQRLLLQLAASRRSRVRSRYMPALRAALDGSGADADAALAVLRRVPRRHRAVLGEALLEPLRVLQGSMVDRARFVALEVGLLHDWRRGLSHGTWATRSRAALALGRVRDPEAGPALVALLDSPHEELRAAAVDALGWMGDAAAVRALVARIGQQSRHQQARLVDALRRIGPAATASIVRLDAPRSGERRLLAEVLGHVGGIGARATLLEWTVDPDPMVRATSWRAIGVIGIDDRAAYHALRALGDDDARVRSQAAQVLGRTGRTDFVPYLAQHLDDEWEVAAQGARALSRLGETGLAALRSREAAGLGGHGLELARHFLWEQARP